MTGIAGIPLTRTYPSPALALLVLGCSSGDGALLGADAGGTTSPPSIGTTGGDAQAADEGVGATAIPDSSMPGSEASSAAADATSGVADAATSVGPLADASDVRPPTQGPYSILVYSFTTGYRHASIPAGIDMIRALGATSGFTVDVKGTMADANGSYASNVPAPGDMAYFTAANLAKYAAIVFLSVTTPHGPTTNVALDVNGKAAFQQYIRAGGGFVGIHTATDCEFFWDWYHQMVGATFTTHGVGPGTLHIEDPGNPATKSLPNPWMATDEWYNFTANPRPLVHVLTTVAGSNYDGTANAMGDHPNAWCKTFEGGRIFQTARGHFSAAYTEPAFRSHVLGGIEYAAGVAPANCSVPSGDAGP
jgi:cytochrome c